MLDSGTTAHMTPFIDALENPKECSVPIALGDDSVVHASHRGTQNVSWSTSEGNTKVSLSNTLGSEDLAMPLLSISALTAKRLSVLFLPNNAVIMDLDDNMRQIGTAFKGDDGLYYIGTNETESSSAAKVRVDRAMMAYVRKHAAESQNQDSDSEHDHETTDTESISSLPELLSDVESDTDYDSDLDADWDSDAGSNSEDIGEDIISDKLTESSTDMSIAVKSWHRRLGHFGTKKDIKDMIDQGLLPSPQGSNAECTHCARGKFRRFYRGSLTKATTPGHIHADLVGRVKPDSHEGYIYFLTIVDEFTRFVEVVSLRTKGEASNALLHFMNVFERQSGQTFRSLHTDGGSEFERAMAKFEDMGIAVTTTTPYTPPSNGLVERTQGVLLSLARSCLVESKLPLEYWMEALLHVTKSRNIVIHSATGKAPHC